MIASLLVKRRDFIRSKFQPEILVESRLAAYVKIREWMIGIWPSGNKYVCELEGKIPNKEFFPCPNKIMSMAAERR
jgi:hypothetical protein